MELKNVEINSANLICTIREYEILIDFDVELNDEIYVNVVLCYNEIVDGDK